MRRAKLTIEEKITPREPLDNPDYKRAPAHRTTWLRLTARNSKIQMAGETVQKGARARVSVLRSFRDVLEAEGFVVMTPEELGVIVDKAKDFGRYELNRANAKAALGND